MIVLDASVLIAHFDSADPHHEEALRLLEKSTGEALGASTITLADTLVSPARAGRLADAQAALDHLGVVELSLGENAANRLAELRAETSLKVPDCCVLAAAEEHAGTVASFDTSLVVAARKLHL